MQTAKKSPLEQQLTQPLRKQQRQQVRALPRVLFLIACLLILGVMVTGVMAAMTSGWWPFPPVSHGSKPNTPPASTEIIEGLPSGDNNLAHDFMGAMLHKDWATMWSLLHPDAQKSWQDEHDFVHFEQVKFGSLKLASYQATTPVVQHTWRDPDTTSIYADVATFSISLLATAPARLLTAPSDFALAHGLFNNTLLALAQSQGRWKVLVAGPADPDAPILVPASPPITKQLVPIFMYHHVSNLPTSNLLDYSLTVRTTDFAQQLDWLSQHGYQSVTQSDLFNALYYGKVLPAHPVMLTFDDGYKDVYTDALPALLAHHYRGVFYIITGMIGGRYMTWKQVRTLATDGMQISSHTIHHINIGEPPAGTSTQQELLGSKATLEAHLGQPVQFFCYPTGEPFHHDTVAEQQTVLTDLFNDGYVSATLDPFSLFSAIQNPQTPYQLNRIRVSGGETLQEFTGILDTTLSIGTEELVHPI